MPEFNATCVLGYTLNFPDQTSKFVPIFEGDKVTLETVKQAVKIEDFHGPRRITGCKWEIKLQTEVYPKEFVG